MSFDHLPGAFLEIFFWFQKATLGSRLPLNASRRPKLPLNPSRRPLAAQQHVLWPPAGRFPGDSLLVPSSMSLAHLLGAFLKIFPWFQKATLGSRLALNPSRRPKLPLNPSRRPWRPSSMSLGHLLGAFLKIFTWFQKATLGSRLALNPSRRPKLPLNPSRRLWRPSSMSLGHLPGAFLKIFSWFQKATLGSRLPLNASRRPKLPLNPSRRPLAAQQHVLWPPAGRFPGDFLLVSESDVRQ